jgi:hypothetical protein
LRDSVVTSSSSSSARQQQEHTSNQLKQQTQRYSSNFTPRVHDDEVQVQNQELLNGLQQQQSVWMIPNNYVSSIPVSPGRGVVRPQILTLSFNRRN